MNRTLRIAKRFALPALLTGALLVLAQIAFAQPPVVPDFGVTPPAANCGAYTFTSNATDPDDDITATDWDFGDGEQGNGSPVQHTFPGPGTYTVTESVTDAAGGDDLTIDTTTHSQGVTVANTGTPTANLGATPNPAQLNQTVTLSAAGSADNGAGGAIADYAWDLNGDNNYETDTGTTPTATTAFATGGSHTVRLRVTDNCGAQATDIVSVFVQNTPPTASFTATPSPGVVGQDMTFDASASADTGGSVESYHWIWNDGTADTVATAATTTHAFTTPGDHFVQLFVTDNDGANSSTATVRVHVNAPPTANFVASANPSLIGEEVTFTPTGSADSDGTIASYQWDFDGNGTVDATSLPAAPAVKHTFGNPGDANVKLTVTDNNGGTGDVTRVQTVQATRPSPGFTFSPANPVPGQVVTLRSTSAASTSAGHAITDTQWDFNYSPLADFVLAKRGASVTTSFASAGAHTVGLKVVETGGGFAVAYRTITVNAPPKASFTILPAKPVEGQAITFASTSSDPEGPIAKQAWDLDGDGKYNDGTAAVVTKKLKKGTRNVRLQVTDSKGATSSATVRLKVGAAPLKPAPDVDHTLLGDAHSWGIKILGLYVGAPSRTNVRVICSGSGCPRGKFLKRSGKRKAVLHFSKFNGRSLRAGAKITVIGWRTNSIAEYFTWKVRSGRKAPLKQTRCKALHAKKYHSCG